MVGPSSQISKLLLILLFILIIFYISMDIQLYLRIQNYPIERNYHINGTKYDNFRQSSLQPQRRYQQSLQQYNNLINSNSIDATNTINDDHVLTGIPSIIDSSSLNNNNNNKNDKTVFNNYDYYQLLSSTSKNFKSKNSSLSSILFATTTVRSDHHFNNNNNIKIQKHYKDAVWITCDINPLCDVTVKAILLDHTNHYLFAPLAVIFDNIIGFSKSNFITANMISYFHVIIACIAGRLISSDNLIYRRFGVVLFQFRTFLDDLDGHVARVKKNIRGERSEVGTTGYYIDGLCDGLGCIALMIGITFYLKNNPPRRGYTQLQAVLPVTTNDIKLNNNNNNNGLSTTSSSSLLLSEQSSTGVIYRAKITTTKVAHNVLWFSGQLLLSSTVWNRYIAVYQDMLERNNVNNEQLSRQLYVFRSNWFFSVAWLWRVFNVHSLLHCLLLSIFCDKLWDFLKMIQFSGILVLIVSICATEIHILEVQNFIFNSLSGYNNSNTAL